MEFELPGLKFRPQRDGDRPFLHRLYASTREDELAQVPWTAEQKAAFVDMQFRAQSAHYGQHFPDAQFLVIERAGEPIGRLYLDTRNDEMHVIDIALLPAARRGGVGTMVMAELQARAGADGKSVGIYVERFNPALAWYRRMGFTTVEEGPVYFEMRWSPASLPD